MPSARDARAPGVQAELDEAYELLREFWDTIENSMEGDHPARARLDGWLSRFETALALRSGE